MALAIVNQVLETEDIDADQLSQPKGNMKKTFKFEK